MHAYDIKKNKTRPNTSLVAKGLEILSIVFFSIPKECKNDKNIL